jgi:hypothetical protein
VEILFPLTKNRTLPAAFVVTVIVRILPLLAAPESDGAPIEDDSLTLVTVIEIA